MAIAEFAPVTKRFGGVTAPNGIDFAMMCLCSGLWMPPALLPNFLQRLAPVLPAYHLGRIARYVLEGSGSAMLNHVEALVGFGLVFAGLAWIASSRGNATIK